MKRSQLGALVALLALVACGGDDSSSGPGTGAAGHSGSNGAGGAGLAGNSSNAGGGAGSASAGTLSQGGNGGNAVGAGGAGGSAGSSAGNGGSGGGNGGSGGGNGGTSDAGSSDASSDTGIKPDVTTDGGSDVSTSSDASGNGDAGADASASGETGPTEASSVDSPSDVVLEAAPALNCDAGEGLLLKVVPGTPPSGWVDRTTNCVGVQGAVFTYTDTGGSSAYFTSANFTGGKICVSGTAHHNAVLDSTHWGSTVVIQLNNLTGAELGYNATANGVTGFDFTLSGNNVPATMYAQYRVDGEGAEYCKLITGGAGAKSLLISEGHPGCYLPDGGTAVADATKLTRLEFEIPANMTTDVQFDFCIESVTAKKQ